MDAGWERVAAEIVRARTRLGYRSMLAFARAAGVSKTTMDNLEHARKDRYEPGTLAAVEYALRWEAGSIDAVRRGGRPTPNGDPELTALVDAWRRLSPDARLLLRRLAEEAASIVP